MKFVKFCLLPAFVLLILVVVGGVLWVNSQPDHWHATEEVYVEASVETARDVLQDLGNWEIVAYNTVVPIGSETRVTGEPGPGQRIEFTDENGTSLGSLSVEEVVKTDAGSRVVVQMSSPIMPMRHVIEVVPDGDGALLDWTIEGEAKGFMRKMMSVFASPLTDQVFSVGGRSFRSAAESAQRAKASATGD